MRVIRWSRVNCFTLFTLAAPAIVRCLLAVLVAVQVTCTNNGEVRTSGFERRDSAGITIAVTLGDSARSLLAWSLDSVPDVEIGVVTGEPVYQFDRIRGIIGDREGRIWVMDAGSRQLRVFDSAGSFVMAMGGEGSGPGEFSSPEMVPRSGADTAIVFDYRTRRFTLFTGSGDLLSVSPPSQLPRGGNPMPVGAVGRHVLLEDSGILWIGTGGLNPEPEPGLFRIVDAGTGGVSTLADFPGRQMFTDVSLETKAVLPVPFDIRPSAGVGNITFYITAGEQAEILEYDTLAQLRGIIRLAEPVRQVTQADLDKYIEWRIASTGSEWADYFRNVYRDLPLTQFMPAFEALIVDADGWVWAQIYDPYRAASSGTSWIVFKPDGRACGTVRVPGAIDVHFIARDYVLSLWRDEMRVEHVRRHRLRRGRSC